MLCLLLTYHQIIPDFLDLVFPFGKQSRPQNFHHTAFRQQTRLTKATQGLRIPELGWSGSDFQVCFNLKSVEYSESQRDRPWSIRHCAIAHTFDVETGRATWIVMKGNKEVQKRMIRATSQSGSAGLRRLDTVDRSFAASLVIYKMLCEWLIEDWRWYINFLEDKHQDISRRTIVNEVDLPPPSPRKDTGEIERPQRVQTGQSEKSLFSKFSRKRTTTMETMASIKEKAQATVNPIIIHQGTDLSQPLPPGVNADGEDLPGEDTVEYDGYGQQLFSFRDLRDLHFIDTKAGEVALVIKHVSNILQQILRYYQTLFKLEDFPRAISTKCKEDMIYFEMHMKEAEMELQLQASRIETLQNSVSDCRVLVSLQHPRQDRADLKISYKTYWIFKIPKAIKCWLANQEPRLSAWKA